MEDMAINALYKMRNWVLHQIRIYRECRDAQRRMPFLIQTAMDAYFYTTIFSLITGPLYIHRGVKASWTQLIIAFFPYISILLYFPLCAILFILSLPVANHRPEAWHMVSTALLVCFTTVPAVGAAITFFFVDSYLEDDRFSVADLLFLVIGWILIRTVELQARDGHNVCCSQ
jgi:hypothetical protein